MTDPLRQDWTDPARWLVYADKIEAEGKVTRSLAIRALFALAPELEWWPDDDQFFRRTRCFLRGIGPRKDDQVYVVVESERQLETVRPVIENHDPSADLTDLRKRLLDRRYLPVIEVRCWTVFAGALAKHAVTSRPDGLFRSLGERYLDTA